MRALFVGIDLGTTNSTAAVFDGQQIVPVRNPQGSPLTPSVVRIDARGNVTVGARARRLLDTDPGNTRAEFKRLMGTSHRLAFAAAGVEKRPEELAAEVLKSLRRDVEAQFGRIPDCAVISVPALFELPQTAATSEAARLAGFTRVELIQEPVASAIAAGWSANGEDRRPWLVYDLGGGTFDVSLVETQDGLLRVVGHDGDNFLGGRDFDGAVVRWVIERLRADGVDVDDADPRHAAALRKLRYAAEEAKIELGRTEEAMLSLPALFDGVDVDFVLDRATVEGLVAPLVDRSIVVCRRLLGKHGLREADLGRIVLVGGPTTMPSLRSAVTAALHAPFTGGLDPMTLVAQGAALFAATAGLDAAAVAPPEVPDAVTVWLQFPTMTSDLSPFVVGRLTRPDPRILAVRLRREDGWESPPEPLDEAGAFVIGVSLTPRTANTFSVQGVTDTHIFPLQPAHFTIVHGVALQDPPLSRSIGVALADDTVRVFLERGCPLPVRRTFPLKTVEHAVPGGTGAALRVPIVQGELPQAHLNRLVGTLEITADQLTKPLPLGTTVEVALELDRGGQLSASAKLPDGQVFREVAQLVAPHLPVEALKDMLDQISVRLERARPGAGVRHLAVAAEADNLLAEARPCLRGARGGDADAAEKARRCLLDAEGAVAQLESASAWPALEEACQEEVAWSAAWVGRFGTATEQQSLDEMARRLRGALTARQSGEIKRLRDLVRRLGNAAWARSPGAWQRAFEYYVARLGEATDLREANALATRGRAELARGDEAALQRTVDALDDLMPPDVQERKRAWHSGVRE